MTSKSPALVAIDDAIDQVGRLRKSLKRTKSRQVSSIEERQLVESSALAWFNGALPEIVKFVAQDALTDVNEYYRELMDFIGKFVVRAKYDATLKALGSALALLRRDLVSGASVLAPEITTDEPPNFARVASDPLMQSILRRRWIECRKCVTAGSPLAATVMMGGMLESLLVARVNLEPDKTKLFASKHAPVDHKSGKKLPFQDWTLKTYIDVASDLGWITQSAKDVGAVIRDYRNYIHPHKEYAHNVALTEQDAEMFWEITKHMSRQLLT